MHFHEWVFVAIFPFDRLIGWSGALGKKGKPSGLVAKYDRAICGWVYTAFHNLTIVAHLSGIVKGVNLRYTSRVTILTTQPFASS